MTWNPPGTARARRFFAITAAALAEPSTKQTSVAPRLSASIPTAPVPAYRSSHLLPSRAAGLALQRTLNNVSRKRSDVGRVSIPGRETRGRRRYLPAITRNLPPCQEHELRSSLLHFRVFNPQR